MIESLFSLSGRRMLITGGTRGIGRAISSHFARAGADVIANYARDEDAARSLQAELAAQRVSITACRADISTSEGRERLLAVVGEAPLSAFVHCAASGVHRAIEGLTLRHWDFTFAVNVRAFFDLTKGLLPRFQEGSSIVAVSSEGAMHAFRDYALVGATKGALESFARHLALELAPRGIRVNILSPGTVLTQALDAFEDRDALVNDALRRSPRGRLTTPEEVAYAAHFLCSDASAALNGHTLVVDGGQRIKG